MSFGGALCSRVHLSVPSNGAREAAARSKIQASQASKNSRSRTLPFVKPSTWQVLGTFGNRDKPEAARMVAVQRRAVVERASDRAARSPGGRGTVANA